MHLAANAEPAEGRTRRCAGRGIRQCRLDPLHWDDQHQVVVYRLPDCTEGNIEQLGQQLQLLSLGVQQKSSECKQSSKNSAREWVKKWGKMTSGDTSKPC